MKKTIKINIGGIVFQLDEDAYDQLKIYLDLIGRRFGKSEEGREITEDIERRIADFYLTGLVTKRKPLPWRMLKK